MYYERQYKMRTVPGNWLKYRTLQHKSFLLYVCTSGKPVLCTEISQHRNLSVAKFCSENCDHGK